MFADLGINLPDSPFGVDDNERLDLEQMMEAEDMAKVRRAGRSSLSAFGVCAGRVPFTFHSPSCQTADAKC